MEDINILTVVAKKHNGHSSRILLNNKYLNKKMVVMPEETFRLILGDKLKEVNKIIKDGENKS